MRIHVLGKGAWGVALTGLLRKNGHEATAWDRYDEPEWPPGLEAVLLVIPSRYLGGAMAKFSPPGASCPVFSSVKGIEPEGFLRASQIAEKAWGPMRFCALSGPSFAAEVAAGMPTAVAAASADEDLAKMAQALFHRPEFRVYTNPDVTGVELGGALKNVFAIAAGLCAGLGLGDNSLAALVTRALAEMARVGVRLGGRLETFMGLSGAGDLMLTCYSDQSRNRRFGLALAQGKSVAQIEADLGGVAEGQTTVTAVRELARKEGVKSPLVEQVHDVIYHGKSPRKALEDLLARDPASEA